MNTARILGLPQVETPRWAEEPSGGLERLNPSQVRYVARSSLNRTQAAAPKALAPLMAAALERLENRVGPLDPWVARRLGWTMEELASKLTSEQVDAVALATDAMDRREGFLVSDVTGFGKGRIAAAVARYAALSGRLVVFFTEKANLFSDFWRDVRDIGSEEVFGRPFLLNAGARIVDTSSSDGRVIFPALKKKEVDAALSDGLPGGTRLVMATYSQFSRKGRKLEWLEGLAEGAHLMMDEGHNQASGDSATGKNLAAARELAASTTYSTATAGRDVMNLTAYGSVFPWLGSLGDPETLTPAQATAFAEASVRVAAGRGSLLRREHDLSNMVLTLLEDRENLERNRAMADAAAPVLSRMALLGNRVFAETERRNAANKEKLADLQPRQRRAASEFWFSHNFGAKLNGLVGQLLVALKVDMAVTRCVQDLREGVKPVVVVESTMESLMRELTRDPDERDAMDEEAEVPEEGAEEDEEASPEGLPPSFGEALRIMAERMLRVTVRRGGPEGEKETVELDDPEMVALRDEVVALAKAFPALPLSPIDDIRARIEREGREAFERGEIARPWVTDEVSARSVRVVDGRYVPMGARDRNVSVARFNNGETDVMVLTNAASTGLSLHDASHFRHHAKRRMYELRAPRNVVQRVQMWGRVFRRGQRTEPDFFVLSTGLEKEAFDLAVQNRKVQSLSASVTGDARAGMVVAAHDYEDATGNDIAYDLLMENPALARKMAISLRVEREEGDKSLFWVGKLLRRLWLLSDDEAKMLFGQLVSAYEERVRAGLVRDGRPGTLEGRWSAASRRLLERGDGSDNPLTGEDVYVTDISSASWHDPIGLDELRWMLSEVRKGFEEKAGRAARALREGRDAALEGVLFRPWRTVAQALKAPEDNPVRRMDATVRELTWFASNVRPGAHAVLPGEDGEPEECVVIDMRVPTEDGNLFSSRDWALSYVIPGEAEVRVVTLDALSRNKAFKVGKPGDAAHLREVFAAQAPGVTMVTRKIIDGSPLGALMAARRLGGGRRVTFTDDGGNEREAVLLPKSLARRVASTPGVASTPEAASAVLAGGERLLSNSLNPGDGVEIRPFKGDRAVISIPSQSKFRKLREDPGLVAAVGAWQEYGQRLEAVLSSERVGAVFTELARLGVVLTYDASMRRAVLEASERTAAAPAP